MEQVERLTRPAIVHSTATATLPDVLERLLDKGVVIAGDIRIKLVDVELLSINIRLLVASVDKAKEMGIDWWEGNPFLSSLADRRERDLLVEEKEEKDAEIQRLRDQIRALERGDG